jgi:serine/threonine-protein kinase RsbW
MRDDMKADKKARTITLVIESRLDNVSLFGVAVKGICDYLSLDKLDSYYIELCAVEAVTNVIRHAYGSRPGHKVEVTLSVLRGDMIFRVSDTGAHMDIKKAHVFHFEPGKPHTIPESGMGLFFIHSLMDEVTYETSEGRNILTLRKHLAKENSNQKPG